MYRMARTFIYFLLTVYLLLSVTIRCLSDIRKFRNRLKYFLGLNIRINHKMQINGKEILYHWKAEKPNTYMFSVLYSYSKVGWGTIKIKQDDTTICEMDIDSKGRYRRGVLHIRESGTVTIEYEKKGGEGVPIFYRMGKSILAEAEPVKPIVVHPYAVCASIASYPPRQDMLRDTINSLIDQVDHLFIYLNNYEHPPEFILKLRSKYKNLHYIVDTNSSHRAAAKFYWLQWHECYWLICDDDIIYPKNYAKTMVQHLNNYKNKSIVGVHGAIFTNGCHQWANRQMLNFEFPIRENQRVHMLGTGTLALHSSIMDKNTWKGMLDYPIENDEILAVKCNKVGIPQYAVKRSALWLRSNKKMQFGIFEETSIDPTKMKRINNILDRGKPWEPFEVFEEAVNQQIN